MKVKRFFARTMPEALKKVKDEMGTDAVILSSKKVDGGVEIVTAIDYQEEQARESVLAKKPEDVAMPVNLSSAKVATMAAEQHVALMSELDKSRSRVDTLRPQRYDNESDDVSRQETRPQRQDSGTARGAVGDDWWDDEPVAKARSTQQNDSPELLAEMKAEILQLKNLLSTSMQDTARKTSAVYQSLQKKLQNIGLDSQWQQVLLDSVLSEVDEGQAWRKVLGGIARDIDVENGEFIEKGGRVAFLGPTGVGKTTTIGKLATRYVLNNGSDGIALVTTDRYRIAAHEQLLVFGRILEIPVYLVHEGQSLKEVLSKLRDKHLVMIDSAGLNQNHEDWNDQIEEFVSSSAPIDYYLVVPAISQPQIMKSTYHAYKQVGLKGCIITKVDEALSLGEVISFTAAGNLPVAYITDGQKIPDDIHPAKASMLVSRAVALANENHCNELLSG